MAKIYTYNTAFGCDPCEECGLLPCRCGWVQGPEKFVQIEQVERAWDELQAVPSYVSRDKSAESGFAREQ